MEGWDEEEPLTICTIWCHFVNVGNDFLGLKKCVELERYLDGDFAPRLIVNASDLDSVS